MTSPTIHPRRLTAQTEQERAYADHCTALLESIQDAEASAAVRDQSSWWVGFALECRDLGMPPELALHVLVPAFVQAAAEGLPLQRTFADCVAVLQEARELQRRKTAEACLQRLKLGDCASVDRSAMPSVLQADPHLTGAEFWTTAIGPMQFLFATRDGDVVAVLPSPWTCATCKHRKGGTCTNERSHRRRSFVNGTLGCNQHARAR